MKFAADCEQKFLSLSMYISTDGHEGNDESMSGVAFDPKIHFAAARLGPRITERAIKLALTKTRAEAYVATWSGEIEEHELNDKIISYLSLLCLRARFLADLASEKAGLRARPPSIIASRRDAEHVAHDRHRICRAFRFLSSGLRIERSKT